MIYRVFIVSTGDIPLSFTRMPPSFCSGYYQDSVSLLAKLRAKTFKLTVTFVTLLFRGYL